MGSSQRKKTVELKLITSTPRYKLNNLEIKISGFAKNSILAVLAFPNLEAVMFR